jgi:hypothetical protein
MPGRATGGNKKHESRHDIPGNSVAAAMRHSCGFMLLCGKFQAESAVKPWPAICTNCNTVKMEKS